MLDVMEILKNASKGNEQHHRFLATHPAPETRLDEIRASLKHTYPNGIPPELTRGRPLRGGTGTNSEYDTHFEIHPEHTRDRPLRGGSRSDP